jgi:hypothetical protein
MMDIGRLIASVNLARRMAMAAAVIGVALSAQLQRGLAQPPSATTLGKTPQPAASTPKPPPRITPSKTTTKILGPLDDDGYVDYVAALNEIYSRDVTPENNAGLLFVRASRIDGFGPAERKRFFELLHCEPLPEQGAYLTDIEEYVQKQLGRPPSQREKQRGPWLAEDFPLIAQWLQFNEKPLQLVVEGTRRPECYFPFVLPKGECLIEMPLPALQASRTAARLLLTRAMLSLRRGEITQAENDLIACHRLGRLIGTTPYCLGTLVGLSIDADAWAAETELMRCDELSAAQALAYQRELRRLPPLPRLDEIVDQGERLTFLQSLGVLARPKALNGERPTVWKEMPPFVSETTLLDWSEVLLVANDQFDKVVAVLRQPTIPRRQAAWERFHRQLTAMHEEVKRGDFNKLPLRNQLSQKAISREIGKILITSLFPAVRAVSEAENRAEARVILAQVGFALAAYRRDHGSYPKDLSELAPRYIAQVPADPFIERPLHYERRPDGFLLYSVGANAKDDGGASLGEKPSSDDIVIKVVRSVATISANEQTTVVDASSLRRYETLFGLMGLATILFSLAMFFGIATTLVRLFVTRRLSKCLAFVHVAIAAPGLLVLTYAAVLHGLPFLGLASLSLFAVAALAGVRIFAALHLRKKTVPVWLLLGHGAIAIAAFALLCVAYSRIDALYRPLRTAPLRKLDARKDAGKNDASTQLKCQNYDDTVGPCCGWRGSSEASRYESAGDPSHAQRIVAIRANNGPARIEPTARSNQRDKAGQAVSASGLTPDVCVLQPACAIDTALAR